MAISNDNLRNGKGLLTSYYYGSKIKLLWKRFVFNLLTGNTGDLVFNDIITSVRQAVSEIRATDSSVNILIAVGHAGFTIDKKIAKLVDGIDIVVGGHTNTFLYTGEYTLLEFDVLFVASIAE